MLVGQVVSVAYFLLLIWTPLRGADYKEEKRRRSMESYVEDSMDSGVFIIELAVLLFLVSCSKE